MGSIQKELLTGIRTLEEWNEVWTKEILVGVVKENTRAMYRDTMERHILPFLGKTPLKELTSRKVGEWVAGLQESSIPGTMQGKMTEGTVRNTLSVC